MSAKSFRDLRAWQAARAFKIRIYALVETGSISRDEHLQNQLRDAAASAPSQISEGFGRFDPADFGRFVKMARASIVECQNHLQDAVDRRHITDDEREEYEKLVEPVLREIGGLLDYLQSPEAKRNAERIRQKRDERRQRRKHEQRNREQPNREQPNPEQRTPNPEQPNPEQRTPNPEP
jgi:four helix bundle protein